MILWLCFILIGIPEISINPEDSLYSENSIKHNKISISPVQANKTDSFGYVSFDNAQAHNIHNKTQVSDRPIATTKGSKRLKLK